MTDHNANEKSERTFEACSLERSLERMGHVLLYGLLMILAVDATRVYFGA